MIGYASLPKLTNAQYDDASLGPNALSANRSADELMESIHLPPRPDEMIDEKELEELNEKIHQLELESEASALIQGSSSSTAPSSRPESLFDKSSGSFPPTPQSGTGTVADELRKFHANLEARLHPFWASSLGSRTVHVAVYATDPEQMDFKSPPLGSNASDEDYAFQRRPIASTDVMTAADGSFSFRFTIPWQKMCVHPAALHIAFGESTIEHNLYVTADLMPPPSRPPTPNSQVPYAVRTQPQRAPRSSAPTARDNLAVPLTHTTVRLISDIDDTVKMSGVISGARAAFYNVFVKDLSESVIPGMGEWYTDMWKRGVRFHYVVSGPSQSDLYTSHICHKSNGPFELLPVVSDFLALSQLPPGSIRLRSYAGRSLFNGLLAAPAERKRAGILDVLDSFPDSKFILVGDSGEQDLELYASLAAEARYAERILAIFIRDANNPDHVPPLEDPTGELAYFTAAGLQRRPTQSSPSSSPPDAFTPMPLNGRTPNATHRPMRSVSGSDMPNPRSSSYTIRQPKRTKSDFQPPANGDLDYFTSTSLIDSPVSEEPPAVVPPSISAYPPLSMRPSKRQDDETSSTSSRMSLGRTSTSSSLRGAPPMTEAERKQFELQRRVHNARKIIPARIPLRVFRQPWECVEANDVLDSLNVGRAQV